MNKAIQQLIGLGLSEKQARVYLALVQIGRGTAYAVAKNAGVKRPTVYVLLDELRKKGLVKKIPHAKNQVFIAKDMGEFLAEFEEKLYQAKHTLPNLLSKSSKTEIKAHMFEGEYELQSALEYRRSELKNSEMLAFYGSPQDNKKIPDIYYKHAKALELQNTKTKVIVPDVSSLKKFRALEKDFNQEALYLPKEEYSPRVSVEIGKEFSKIFLHTESQALVIESKEFSDFMKQIFNIIWEEKVNKINMKNH